MVANICNNLYNNSIFLFVTFHDVYSNVFIIYYFLFPVLFQPSSLIHLTPLSILFLFDCLHYLLLLISCSLPTFIPYPPYSSINLIVSSNLLLLSFSFITFFLSHPLPFIPLFSHLFPPPFLLFSFFLYPLLTSPNSRPPFLFLFHLLFPSLYAHFPSLPFISHHSRLWEIRKIF